VLNENSRGFWTVIQLGVEEKLFPIDSFMEREKESEGASRSD
jgi:hypothetical protein